ncbi:MAG: hypothetical protein K6E13_07935 [Lachnospiraceae bacterium]|nr:hypothetical protein [Lachnospiraceae bacterium]
MNKRIRQYVGIIAAIVTYYIVHEGAHLICACIFGVYKHVYFKGIGVQVDVYRKKMTDTELGVFCLAGAAATLFAGYSLAYCSGSFCKIKSKLVRAALYYITIALLMLDPLYLSIICPLVGGGDMNGIKLIFPEVVARVVFGMLFIINGVLFWKKVLPSYKMAFSE